MASSSEERTLVGVGAARREVRVVAEDHRVAAREQRHAFGHVALLLVRRERAHGHAFERRIAHHHLRQPLPQVLGDGLEMAARHDRAPDRGALLPRLGRHLARHLLDEEIELHVAGRHVVGEHRAVQRIGLGVERHAVGDEVGAHAQLRGGVGRAGVVTSSSASAGGACTGTGVPPTRIQSVIGVAKAYITRVGGGPFPTEALDSWGDQIRNRGNEFGSVTGRPRRCGWYDVPLMRYAAMINGFDSLVITKLDVLDEMEKIPVCVGYRLGGAAIKDMPVTAKDMAAIEPVYECVPGWRTSTFGIATYSELPAAAREYLDFLEEKSGVEVG